jgi:DNA polymerase-3 subunit gamma/tau
MGQALYRKYRSKSLSEIVGQDHITQTLTQALKKGRISHAYLFTGPRGVGKTSIARILAHEINNLEYADDSPHMDIIEIDAASNRRIDEIRELRDKVYVAPTSTKYKVYIIDEVHMLTREAFNALLKTLEEPPEHAVFILATTDAHKLPETIVSRTQRFSFKPVPKEQVVAHLKEIAKKEKISVTDEALELLAEHGEGSFRDSISMLDQASSHGDKLNADSVRQLLGIPPAQSIDKLIDSLASGQSDILASNLTALHDQGFQAAAIAKQLSQKLRAQILAGQLLISSSATFTLLNQLLKVALSNEPERYLEIILLQAQTTVKPLKPAAKLASVTEPSTVTEEAPSKAEVTAEEPESPKAATQKSEKTPAEAADGSDTPLTAENWDAIMLLLKQRHNTLYGVVRMAEPKFNADGSLSLVFSFAFHQKRINESANQQALDAIINQVIGRHVSINCTLDTSAKKKAAIAPPPPPQTTAPTEDLTAISNIFGGGELLESE